MQIGKAIKSCRKLRGLTLEVVAESSELSVSYLSLVEQSKREPSLSSIEAIAQALNIPINVLLFLAASQKDIPEISSEHIDALANAISELINA